MKEKAGVMKPPMTPNTKPSIYMFLNMYMYIHVDGFSVVLGST